MLLQHLLPVCLAGLAAAATTDAGSSSPLATCNKADVALVEFNSQTQPGLCKSWLNSPRQSSAIQGMTPDELTAACSCISNASQEMKLALQAPVVRIVKSATKPAPKPVVKTTAKTTPKTTAKTTSNVQKTTVKTTASTIKTSTSSSTKKLSSTTPNKAVTSSVKTSASSIKSASSSVSSSSVKYCGLYPCSKLTLKPWSTTKTSAKTSAKTTSLVSSSSSRPCIGVACSKLTAKTSTGLSVKTSSSVKSSSKSSSAKPQISGASSKSGSKVSSASTASKSSTKVSSSVKSGTKVSSSVTGTVGKGISSKKSSSTTLKAKPTSDPSSGDQSGSDSGGDDSGSSPTDTGDAGSSETTSPVATDEPAATASATDDGSAVSDDGSSPTSVPDNTDPVPSSTLVIPATTLTSTKPKSATTIKSSPSTSSGSTKSTKLDASVPVVTQPSSSAAAPRSSSTITSTTKPVVKPSPICTSPLSSNETFQLYISGTNSAIDGTPMQGLPNGATAVGFSVGYAALNFTLDCTTGYVYWGSGSVLSGNRQAFSVKSQSVVVAPLGDSNNAPLSCNLDSNFALSCQYTSSRSPDAFQGWAVSAGDARYLAMSQSNSTGITLKAVPLKSNNAVVYPTHSSNQKLLSNGDFAASSTAPWNKFTQGKSSDMGLTTPAVNASGSCYAFAGMLSITPNNNFVNGYAWGGISQPGVTLYMGEQLFLGYDMLLNYPMGLPSGVRCDIQVKGTEHDTLSYVRYDSSSPAFVSFNTTTTASYNGTGTFSITAYCQGQPGGPWPALNLGFNNVRLLAAYDPTDVGAALTCGFKGARDTIQSATLQPYCSSLLSYTTPTTTLTEVISTTTTSTLTVNFAKRRRGLVTPAPDVSRSMRPRQLDVPANDTMTASSMVGGTANPLATFAPQDVTDACSVEAMPVSTTITETTSTTTTITAYATQTKSPNLFYLSSSGNRGLYVSREGSGAVLFTSDINAAHVFYIDSAGVLRSWQDPSLTLVDHYEPNSGAADNRIYIEAPSSASYPVTCSYRGPNAGDYYGSCQSSGPPNGNPVVYGFGWCPQTNALYMIPNSSNVRCGGGYAFLGFFLVAAS